MSAAAIPTLPEPRKLLVVELAGLGDNVHLLPALWLVRNTWPRAQLHVMANAHVAGLFRLTPWVDRIWAYPNAPKPGLAGNWDWGRRLRAERFDLLINSNGSDRSSLLSWLTRAPIRISRRPADGGPPGWSRLFTQVLQYPYYEEPMYRQKWHCFKQLGLAGEAPEFHASIDPQLRRDAGIAAVDEGRYIHLSPFTTVDARELPAAQFADLIDRLRTAFPDLRIALSCANTPRERRKLDGLLPLLREPPWRVYPGTLDIAQFAAVIQSAALNLSGDTGSLHLAMMTGTPAVSWFRVHQGVREWTPEGARYRLLIAEGGAPDALHGIDNQAVLRACGEVMR